ITLRALPSDPTVISRAMQPVRNSTRPVASALGTYVTSILDLAEIEHPTLQVLAPMHAGRPFQGFVGIASGSRTMCSPSRWAPCCPLTLAQLNVCGAVGYGLLRGGSKGLACAPTGPETPSSYSTRV